jgi:hypothetical protein
MLPRLAGEAGWAVHDDRSAPDEHGRLRLARRLREPGDGVVDQACVAKGLVHGIQERSGRIDHVFPVPDSPSTRYGARRRQGKRGEPA